MSVCPHDSSQGFVLIADLGTITVPSGYSHRSRLAEFRMASGARIGYWNGGITDGNFPNPTRILMPGDRLSVRLFEQIIDRSDAARISAFLASQRAVHTGAQGASMVLEQKHDLLPMRMWCQSFDEGDRLWEDDDHSRRMPRISRQPDRLYLFDAACSEGHSSLGIAFLCFSEA